MYFEKPGKQNTEKTLEIVKKAVSERNIKHVVVASCKGHTAKLFQEANLGVNLVCVTHAAGFEAPGEMEMPEDIRKELVDSGVKVLTTTHVLSGVERGISRNFGGAYPVEIIAHTLRMSGQGTKVCVEIAVMALDAGLIPYGEDIIAVGGSSRGADTALILRPAHASNIFDTWISEILCKPASK
ncbi:pyruvate kinase alpha/beta domain-containing protein [Tepidanaerobacter acetatoxydans]|uniref:pyruvate kinase alpha/beta domain-containing protein n=1 Tax=Tepidanaerobacter acetatoxydans TaxID=499229 RepID=UPI001BD33175|nr:pyruvate kinase alpha/beta domain-containing protein [Tepidanaerobacter acetatoxydans]